MHDFMRSLRQVFYFLIIIAIIQGCAPQSIRINDTTIEIEVVSTPSAREQGLMHRTELCDNCGMLFVFDEVKVHSFWMKNTLLPLDMVFITEDFVITDILQAEPCYKDPCPLYTPDHFGKFVLELHQGFALKHSITVGDTIRLK
jgi:uncharacterized protein